MTHVNVSASTGYAATRDAVATRTHGTKVERRILSNVVVFSSAYKRVFGTEGGVDGS